MKWFHVVFICDIGSAWARLWTQKPWSTGNKSFSFRGNDLSTDFEKCIFSRTTAPPPWKISNNRVSREEINRMWSGRWDFRQKSNISSRGRSFMAYRRFIVWPFHQIMWPVSISFFSKTTHSKIIITKDMESYHFGGIDQSAASWWSGLMLSGGVVQSKDSRNWLNCVSSRGLMPYPKRG